MGPLAAALLLVALALAEAQELLRYRVDASAEGCTGLFWRTWSAAKRRFVLGDDQQNPPWPRNGATVQGHISDDDVNFLLLDGGRALPFHDDERRYTYLHPVDEPAQGFLPKAPAQNGHVYDMLILGSGPAGLTAAVYAGRAARSVAVVGGPKPGGSMMLAKAVENFPGAKSGPGSELMAHLVEQAASFGARFQQGTVRRIRHEGGRGSGLFAADLETGAQLRGRSVIVATGAHERWLGIPGEEPLRGKSLHTCAYCDGRFYEGQDVCVIGGGDGALEAAGYLARLARTVTLVHRRGAWRGSPASAARVEALRNVRALRPFVVERWLLQRAGRLSGVRLRHATNDSSAEVSCVGAFVEIGREPATGFLPRDVARDARGFVELGHHMMTNLPGLFACGQVADPRYQQAVTASAAGAQAAMDAARWLDGDLDAAAGALPASAHRPLRGPFAREDDPHILGGMLELPVMCGVAGLLLCVACGRPLLARLLAGGSDTCAKLT